MWELLFMILEGRLRIHGIVLRCFALTVQLTGV